MGRNEFQTTNSVIREARSSVLLVLTIIFTLLFSCLLTGCTKTKTLDLMEFATVNFSGVDSKGTANVSVDWSAFENTIAAEIADEGEQFGALLDLESNIGYALDKTAGLSNGDTVTLTVSWNEEVAKKYGFSFKGEDRTFTVEKLQEAVEIDLFADIYVDFEGVSPDLSVKIRNTSKDPFIQNVRYTAEPDYMVAEGDSITVKATYLQSNADKYGYIPISDEKTYVVENVDKYISDFNQIPEDILAQMDQQARDVIESKLVDFGDCLFHLHPDDNTSSAYYDHTSVKIDSIQLKEYQFFKLKDGAAIGWNDVYNSIFLVYEIKATDNAAPDGFVVYLPVYYSNMILCDTGDFNVILTDAYITSAKSNSYDSLYRNTVSYNKANYNYTIIEVNKN